MPEAEGDKTGVGVVGSSGRVMVGLGEGTYADSTFFLIVLSG